MKGATFVGFGFGPIQLGLFLAEAFAAGAFGWLVVAYPRPQVITAVRRAGGTVSVNVARRDRLEQLRFGSIEMRDVNDPEDRAELVAAIAEAQELATALSSVRDYTSDRTGSVHRLLAAGLERKLELGGPRALIYAAENHNRAAALLMEAVTGALPAGLRPGLEGRVQAVDTVIAKMSRLEGLGERQGAGLAPIAPGLERAALVEAFNDILISRVALEGFERGLAIFDERPELRPFEEAKLYGHNAVHALLAYLGGVAGLRTIREAAALCRSCWRWSGAPYWRRRAQPSSGATGGRSAVHRGRLPGQRRGPAGADDEPVPERHDRPCRPRRAPQARLERPSDRHHAARPRAGGDSQALRAGGGRGAVPAA